MIFPTVSKVRNTGCGEDGVHCGEVEIRKGLLVHHRNYLYDEQPIDESDRFESVLLSKPDETKRLHECMETFFRVSMRELIISRIVALICRLGGRKYLVAFVRKLRKAGR